MEKNESVKAQLDGYIRTISIRVLESLGMTPGSKIGSELMRLSSYKTLIKQEEDVPGFDKKAYDLNNAMFPVASARTEYFAFEFVTVDSLGKFTSNFKDLEKLLDLNSCESKAKTITQEDLKTFIKLYDSSVVDGVATTPGLMIIQLIIVLDIIGSHAEANIYSQYLKKQLDNIIETSRFKRK